MNLNRRTLMGLMGAAAVVPAWATAQPEHVELPIDGGRKSTVTIWRPRGHRRGTILFSHGAQSSPRYYDGLILPGQRAGYEIYAPLHVDSKEHPDTAQYKGFATWRARIEDMRALAAYVKAHEYIAAGHSFGALVALTLGGASAIPPEGITGELRDPRVRAAVAFSPPAPIPKLIEANGYATLAVPALIQTGDRDLPPGSTGADAWHLHLAAYDAAAPGGSRYALVLQGVDHYFGGLICSKDYPGPDQSEQLKQTAEISTLFLDAYGTGRRSARRSLDRQLSAAGPTQLQFK